LAYIATDGELSGPSLELAYQEAHSKNPGITRDQVALEMATR
jgi:hypothetical protein